ncbi:MAG: YbjN domain-containing protein, partial [Coleofasciculus sp.]
MTTKTDNHQLDSELTLYPRTTTPLTLHTITLSLYKDNDQLIECRLTFNVNLELYERIDTQALFNLKPEIRGNLSSGKFLPEADITIETSLKPDLLQHLTEHAADANKAATYLLNLSQEQPNHPLLSTENWLALSVKQQQESGETGYSTIWAYINPSALASGETSSEEMNQAVAKFFKEWTETNLSAVTQKATSQMLDGMLNFFKELADVSLDALEKQVPSTITKPEP